MPWIGSADKQRRG